MEKLLTIGAIIIGWALNEFSSMFRKRKEEVRTKKSLITETLLIHSNLSELIRSFKHAAEISNKFDDMEAKRQRILREFLYSDHCIDENLFKTTYKLSKYNPIDALKIHFLCKQIRNFHKLKLNKMSNDPQLYLNTLLTFETILQSVLYDLEKIITNLAWSTDLRTYIKVRKYIKEHNNLKYSSFLDELKVSDDLVEFVRKSTQSSEREECSTEKES